MSKMISTAVLAATFALVSTPAAAATTLTFSNACGGVCADGDNISQSYGDIAGLLDISYRSVLLNGSIVTHPTSGNARAWSTDYGNLNGVIWGAEGGALEIAFRLLDPTKTITFNSVDYAAWGGANVETQIGLYAFTNNIVSFVPLMASAALTAPTEGHATWAPNFTSANGFILHFGPDGYNGGLDNLTFTISNVNVGGAVPEPTTWLSMILGFGLVGAAARRSMARSAAAIV